MEEEKTITKIEKEYEDIVLIGAAIVDIYGKSFERLIPSDSNPGRISIYPGGVSRNVSENLGRLGLKVSLITSLSQDPFSQVIRKSCAEVGINLSHAYENKKDPSSMYMAILDEEGEMNLALSDTTVLDNMPISHLEGKDRVFRNANILVIDPSLPRHLMQYIVEKYPEQRIILDPVSIGKAKHLYDFVGKFHTIKCNEMEASYLSDIGIEDSKDIKKAATILLGKGLDQVFITRSKKGVYYASKSENGFVQSYAKEIVNVTGAGDAFTAGIVYGMTNHLNLRETAEFASSMSALSLESIRTVNPELSIERVKEYMSRGEE